MTDYIQEVISENITTDTTFKKGYQYIIANSVFVNAKVTIENGSLISILNDEFLSNSLNISNFGKVVGDEVLINSVKQEGDEYVVTNFANNNGLQITGTAPQNTLPNYKYLDTCKKSQSKCEPAFLKINKLTLDNIGGLNLTQVLSYEVDISSLTFRITSDQFEFENIISSYTSESLNLKELVLYTTNSGVQWFYNAPFSVACNVNISGGGAISGLGIRNGAKASIKLDYLQSTIYPESSNLYVDTLNVPYYKNVVVNKKTIFYN